MQVPGIDEVTVSSPEKLNVKERRRPAIVKVIRFGRGHMIRGMRQRAIETTEGIPHIFFPRPEPIQSATAGWMGVGEILCV
jgi:hypothetical protein